MKKKLNELFKAALEQNYFDFKQNFKELFVAKLNVACEREAKEVTRELARFGVVAETISVPLNNSKDVKDANLFAIESDDEENMVLKFKVGEESKSVKVKKEDEDFYKELQANGFDKADEKAKEKIAMDLNEFMDEVDVDKKDDSMERGDALKAPVVKMEEPDMSKLTGDARLQALKKLGEKKKLEASKKMNEETDKEKEDDEENVEEAYSELIFKIVGKTSSGDEYKSRGYASKEKAEDAMKSMDTEKYKGLSVKSMRNPMYNLTQGNKKK